MARARARHRRHRRFTPRRWLPFLALVAVVVGAVMVWSEEPPSDGTDAPDPVLDVTRLPDVTDADALSTAWYCSGGTAAGEDGTAELSVVLANDDARGAEAEVTVVDEAGERARATVAVPAHGRARVRASEVLEAEWVGVLVEVRGGRVAVDREVVGPDGFDAGPCSVEAADHWFVPSGSTVRGAEEVLSIFNPFPDAASVNIQFATDSGRRTPRALRALSIPGRSVRVVKVGDIVTNRTEIAATVRAKAGRVVVDRVQTYDGSGDPLVGAGDEATTTDPPEGLISTAAIPVRANRWIVPSVRISNGVRTQIAVYNPGSREADLDLVLHYQEPDRLPELEPVSVTLRPRSQAVVDLTDIPGIVPDSDLWVDVRSLDEVPVVAERISYFGEPSPRTGATATAASPLAATDWMVTQGGATRSRSTTVAVVNPGDADAKVTVIVLTDGDRRELTSAAVTVPGGDRRSLDLADAGAAATVIVHGSRPLVVSSSIALLDGTGISVHPAFPYPETITPLAPLS